MEEREEYDRNAPPPKRRVAVVTRITQTQAATAIERLQHRAEHLGRRIADREREGAPATYDRAELQALRQAISLLRQLAERPGEVVR